MDPTSLLDLLSSGGPYAITALAVFGLVWERKESKRKDDRLLELATHQIQTMTGVEAAVSSLEKVLTEVLRRM